MEGKSFYSGIKVQSPANLSPLFQLPHSLRWNGQNTWNTLPVLPIHKNCYIPLTLISSVLFLFLFSKIIKRNTVLYSCKRQKRQAKSFIIKIMDFYRILQSHISSSAFIWSVIGKDVPPLEYECSVLSEAGRRHSETLFQLISLGIQLQLHDFYLAVLLAIGHMSY